MDINNPPLAHTIHYFALTGDRDKLFNLVNHSATPLELLDEDGRTPLHLAAWGGSRDALVMLLEKGVDPDRVDSSGATPLQNAAYKGHLACLQVLLDYGAQVNTYDSDGSTPLHKAALLTSSECATLLISKGALVTARTTSLDTPLHYAAAGGHPQCIDLLIKNGAPVDAPDQEGVTPLHQAAFCGHAEAIMLLLRRGARVDSKDQHGLSPLHNAACAGHVECLELLVSSGENINTVDTDGVTPLHQACFNGHLQCTKRLLVLCAQVDLRDEMGETPLHKAAFNGHIEICRALLQVGVNVDVRDQRQATPLHLSCYNGLVDCASFLIENGADLDSRDDEGASPLHKASFNGHVACNKLLLDKGCGVNSVDNEGATPLHKAAFSGKKKCLKSLIDNNANTELCDNQGGTALHNAAYGGHGECVIVLVKRGANVNATDSRLFTPLHLAAAVGSIQAVDCLLAAGADVDASNQNGKSALAYAVKKGHSQVARAIIRAGANITNKDRKNRSSMDLNQIFGTLDPAEIASLVQARSGPASPSLMPRPPAHPSPGANGVSGSPQPARPAVSGEEERRRQVLRQVVAGFNAKPAKGLELAVSTGLVAKDSPHDYARFLEQTEDLSKKKIGEYLGEGDEWNVRVLHSFVDLMQFGGLDFDTALRKYLSKFRLPGEAQKIDRMMEAFAQQYHSQNMDSKIFQNSDAVYVLAFSVLMLHTDAHNPSIKKKMTKAEFIRNNSGVNNGGDLPQAFMEELYDKIVTNEIKMETDDATRFTNAEKKGWLTKQGGRIKTWKRRWFILSNNCLFYFKSSTDAEPCGIIPLENLVVSPANMGRKKFCFVLHHQSKDEMKACKVSSDGTLVKANHASYFISAANQPEMDAWIQAIQSNIHRNPFLELLEKKEAELKARKKAGLSAQFTASNNVTPSPASVSLGSGRNSFGSSSGGSSPSSSGRNSSGAGAAHHPPMGAAPGSVKRLSMKFSGSPLSSSAPQPSLAPRHSHSAAPSGNTL
eukprot:TRINITY_DN638_c0_g1_i7.p1 TRINITY_DN638_c0_g1~~TRINITY_DN638_c0_g1_i7.p1  ORF type:complete len:1001 (+),score=251.77 TRINITY_DN638_c0_g1_i7:178-3180(+)